MLDDLTFAVEAKDVDASSFLAGPIQITHLYESRPNHPPLGYVEADREPITGAKDET